MARRWLIAGALIVLGLGLTACSKEVSANNLEVGDCTNEDLEGAVGDVDTVDCDESHTAEVFALFDIEGDDFPGASEITQEATDGCNGDRFEDYVGLPYEESEIFSTYLVPTEETWNDADDRTVICLAVTSDGDATEGSVEGANR
jgi:hypothetical protein